MEIHRRVRELRRGRGWSQDELARRSGVPQSTVSAVESGRHRASVETVRLLARGLGVAVVDIVGSEAPDDYLVVEQTEPASVYSAAPESGPLRELGVAISVRVPVLRTPVRAGAGGDVSEADVVGWEYVEAELAGRRLFGLVVRGGCLEPDVSPGDRVIYEEHASFEDGQMIVAVHDGEPLVKFAVRTPMGWELWSHHEPPLQVNGGTVVYGPVLRVVRQPARWRGTG